MRAGTEERKKLIAAGVFGVVALGYLAYSFLGGSNDTPPPAAPVAVTTTSASPAARVTARVSPSRLDPTLHPESMLLTESLVYQGRGRNIFAAAGSAPAATVTKIPVPIATPRYVAPAPVNNGPPPPPPIDLRFFGTAMRRDGQRQAFLLRGEDVFVAATGDIVSRRYRIGSITARDVEITDLTNNNTQRLPMSQQ